MNGFAYRDIGNSSGSGFRASWARTLRTGTIVVILLSAAALALVRVPPASAGVSIIDLGTLPGGATSSASGINNAGQVVGSSECGPGCKHAFLWDDGAMRDLGTRGGPSNESAASAINAWGVVAGSARVPWTPYDRACLWANGTLIDLLGTPSRAYAINDFGAAVGGTGGSPSARAYLWIGAVPIDLGVPGGEAFGINNLGLVVGYFELTTRPGVHAFLWKNGVVTDLGTLPAGGNSVAYAINDVGQIVGVSSAHAVLWENGTITDLGTLGGTSSTALAINEAGQVVGWSTNATGARHAFTWKQGVMTDLGTLPGGGASIASGINDAGQAAGLSDNGNGTTHAVVWTDTGAPGTEAVAPGFPTPIVAAWGKP